MAAQKLTQSSAFNSGSALWIFVDPKSSGFARKIDFYLNFQIARSEITQSQNISIGLKAILDDNKLQSLAQNPKPPPHLLVATKRNLPCSQVVVLPLKKSMDAWFDEVLQVWRNLNRPSMRLFLPPSAGDIDISPWLPKDCTEVTFVTGDLHLNA